MAHAHQSKRSNCGLLAPEHRSIFLPRPTCRPHRITAHGVERDAERAGTRSPMVRCWLVAGGRGFRTSGSTFKEDSRTPSSPLRADDDFRERAIEQPSPNRREPERRIRQQSPLLARFRIAPLRPPFPGRIIIRIWRLLYGPQRLRNAAQVHPNARPGGNRPRIESTNTSSTARYPAASVWLPFHRSSPAIAASSSGELAMTTAASSRAVFVLLLSRAMAQLAPPLLPSCESAAARAHHRGRASSRAACSSSFSSEPAAASMPACGSPIAAKRPGIVDTVKSAGSHSATSSQASGAETRASGSGRTE